MHPGLAQQGGDLIRCSDRVPLYAESQSVSKRLDQFLFKSGLVVQLLVGGGLQQRDVQYLLLLNAMQLAGLFSTQRQPQNQQQT